MRNIGKELSQSIVEYWNKLIEILPDFIVGVGLFILFLFLAKIIRSFIKKRLSARMDDQLLVNFIGRIVYGVIFTIGLLILFSRIGWGALVQSLLAGAGVSAIVIGFAFKDIGENFLAGFFLAFSRPFSIGDVIEVEGTSGTVKSLSFRTSLIRTFDGKDVFIPNASIIKNQLINYTRDGQLRYDFIVGIDYGDNIQDAIKLIIETVTNVTEIEHNNDLSPFIVIKNFATSTVNLEIFYWIDTNNFKGNVVDLKNELMRKVVENLNKNNFTMPADILELKTYKESNPISISLK